MADLLSSFKVVHLDAALHVSLVEIPYKWTLPRVMHDASVNRGGRPCISAPRTAPRLRAPVMNKGN